jgi:hypothetical protein
MNARYVLVKSYYGLGGDICVLLGAMRYAARTGRTLVVDWSGGLYGQVESGNLFNEYFEAPAVAAPSVLENLSPSVFPPQWADRLALPPLSYIAGVDLTLSRPEEVPADCQADCVVITRDSKLMHRQPEDFFTFARSLRPVARIREQIDATQGRLRDGRPSIGIHFRHGNGEKKVIPPDPRWFRNRINARIRALGVTANDVDLYVATDCAGTLEYFRRFYPHTFDFGKTYRPNGEGALHLNRPDVGSEQKMKHADEALIDMYVLSNCDHFIGSRGFFSLFVRLLRGKRSTVLYEGSRVFDNYKFTEAFYPVEKDPLLGPLLRRTRQPTDGLFVRLTDEGRHIDYYDEPLHLVPLDKTALTNDESLALRQAIAARRTY